MDNRNILDGPDEEETSTLNGTFPMFIVLPLSALLFAFVLIGFMHLIEEQRLWLKNNDLLLASRILMFFLTIFISVFFFLKFSFYQKMSARRVNFFSWLMIILGFSFTMILQLELFQNFNSSNFLFSLLRGIPLAVMMALFATPMIMGIYAYFRFNSVKLLIVLNLFYFLMLTGVFLFFGS